MPRINASFVLFLPRLECLGDPGFFYQKLEVACAAPIIEREQQFRIGSAAFYGAAAAMNLLQTRVYACAVAAVKLPSGPVAAMRNEDVAYCSGNERGKKIRHSGQMWKFQARSTALAMQTFACE